MDSAAHLALAAVALETCGDAAPGFSAAISTLLGRVAGKGVAGRRALRGPGARPRPAERADRKVDGGFPFLTGPARRGADPSAVELGPFEDDAHRPVGAALAHVTYAREHGTSPRMTVELLQSAVSIVVDATCLRMALILSAISPVRGGHASAKLS
jgi:hypothetical protein